MPEREIVIGDERFEALGEREAPSVGADRFVMSENTRQPLVLKEDELFLYANDEGLIPAADNSPFGLYFRDTRFLSRFDLTVGGRRPVLLVVDRGARLPVFGRVHQPRDQGR